MIIRAARPHQNYTVVHNELIEDSQLTWKARGILVYLLSKPDHWRTGWDLPKPLMIEFMHTLAGKVSFTVCLLARGAVEFEGAVGHNSLNS